MRSSRRMMGAAIWVPIAVIGLVGLLAGFLWYQSRARTEPEVRPSAPVATAPSSVPAAASPETDSLLAFTREAPPRVLPIDHHYTAEGLRRLVAALAALPTPPAKEQLSAISRIADELTVDPRSLRHADMAREAFLAAAQAISVFRSTPAGSAYGSADSGRGVQQAAEKIRIDEPLRSQGERVERFFAVAAEAISPIESARIKSPVGSQAVQAPPARKAP